MCSDEENRYKSKIRLIKKGLIEGKKSVSWSAGKDSTAMLKELIKRGIEFDEIFMADTELEYDELYAFVDYFKKMHPDLKITILKPKRYKAKDLFNKNKKVASRLLKEGIPVVDLNKIYPVDWKENTEISLWDFWFYGVVTRKKNAGTVRGFPTTVKGSCWYKREAKVKPLQKAMEESSTIYVGIAKDETKRHKASKKDPRINHILVDFDMTELDCAKYLQELQLHNPIYDMYNRSGCYLCPRQNEWGLYMLWKNNRPKWEITKHWDREHKRVRSLSGFNNTGAFLDRKTMMPIDLDNLEEKFRSGYIPDKNLKYECHSCSNVFA